jgi:hypothetical protein
MVPKWRAWLVRDSSSRNLEPSLAGKVFDPSSNFFLFPHEQILNRTHLTTVIFYNNVKWMHRYSATSSWVTFVGLYWSRKELTLNFRFQQQQTTTSLSLTLVWSSHDLFRLFWLLLLLFAAVKTESWELIPSGFSISLRKLFEVRRRGTMVNTHGIHPVVNTHGKQPVVNTYSKHPPNSPISHIVKTQSKKG